METFSTKNSESDITVWQKQSASTLRNGKKTGKKLGNSE